MQPLSLNDKVIENIRCEVVKLAKELLKEDLISIILYGSCAWGDYSEDSDIDIALIIKSDRLTAQKYNSGLASIATELAMKYFAIVNFVCIPYEEYLEKKSWYAYFWNIETEGEVLFG